MRFALAPDGQTCVPMTLTILATNSNADLYGASRMMIESVRGFRAEGWRVMVTLPEHGPAVDAVEAVGASFRPCPMPALRKGDLNVVGLLRLAWRTVVNIPPGVRLIRKVDPDVIYVTTIIQPLWLVLAWLLRIPVLCHVHEGESSAAPILRKALYLPLLLVRRLVVNSRFSLGVLTEAVPRLSARSEVVYNGVAGPPAVTPPREHLDPPLRMLYVGRLSERKGVQDAVDAVAELSARGVVSELDIIGSVFPGYEWVDADLRERIAKHRLQHRVRLAGFVQDVWPHLAAADVLLVPSRVDEPFGNTAIEGLLAARPVVATRTSGLLEATEGNPAARLTEPGDPAALAESITEIVADWSGVRERAVAGAAAAAERFSTATYRAELCRLVRATARRTLDP
jgi:glycosyltransferase involved in cell wall biosynthesis